MTFAGPIIFVSRAAKEKSRMREPLGKKKNNIEIALERHHVANEVLNGIKLSG